MQVLPIAGEKSRFLVECDSLGCDQTMKCRFTWSPKPGVKTIYARGDECPKCGKGNLEARHVTVDLVSFNAIGSCACEFFCFKIKPRLAKLSKEQRLVIRSKEGDLWRCKHTLAARNHELDSQLDAYEDYQRRRITK